MQGRLILLVATGVSWMEQTMTVPSGRSNPNVNESLFLDFISLGSGHTPVVSTMSPTAIAADWAGETVTLTGLNIEPATRLFVSGSEAAVTVVDGTTLTFEVPAGGAAAGRVRSGAGLGSRLHSAPAGVTLRH